MPVAYVISWKKFTCFWLVILEEVKQISQAYEETIKHMKGRKLINSIKIQYSIFQVWALVVLLTGMLIFCYPEEIQTLKTSDQATSAHDEVKDLTGNLTYTAKRESIAIMKPVPPWTSDLSFWVWYCMWSLCLLTDKLTYAQNVTEEMKGQISTIQGEMGVLYVVLCCLFTALFLLYIL